MNNFDIRPTQMRDLPDLRLLLDETGLFPSEMLEEMIRPALEGEVDAIWLSGLLDGTLISLCFAEPEPMADAVWNMRALAVLPTCQGKGFGTQIVSSLEQRLSESHQRLLIVDTSGAEDFALTRQFYLQWGYEAEARIRDYWADGDDKITYRKRLGNPAE